MKVQDVYKPRVHNFSRSLALSAEHAEADFWGKVYRKAFPTLVSMVSVRNDGWAQRGGIDRVLVLSSGKNLWVDEKVRASDWPDFLLERWSNAERKVPGWVQKDLACDFIAYAFAPSRTCYLLPFQQLRRAWRDNGPRWIATCQEVKAANEGYTTASVAVPIPEVLQAIGDAMRVEWE